MTPLIIKIFGYGLWHFVSKNSAKFMPYTKIQNIEEKWQKIRVYFSVETIENLRYFFKTI